MTGEEFANLLREFTLSAESGDGAPLPAISPKTRSTTIISMVRIGDTPTSPI